MSTAHSNTLAPAGPAMWWDGGERAITAREKARIEEHGPSCFSIALVPATPFARWAADALPDPHGNRYACERAALTLGNLTDDELANAVFLHGNEQPTMADLAAGKALAGIVYLTAAKDRIRWLSRALADATAPRPAELAEQQGEVIVQALADAYAAGAEGLQFGGLARLEALASALAATGKQQVGEVQGYALAALKSAMPYLETLHSIVGGEARASVWRCIERGRLALAARQPGAQEPVAWQWKLKTDEQDEWVFRTRPLPNGITEDPACEHRALYAAPPVQGIDLHRLVPPEWLSELIGGQIDDLTAGHAWRQGFNQCRERTLLLVEQALGFPTDQQRDAAPGVANA